MFFNVVFFSQNQNWIQKIREASYVFPLYFFSVSGKFMVLAKKNHNMKNSPKTALCEQDSIGPDV